MIKWQLRQIGSSLTQMWSSLLFGEPKKNKKQKNRRPSKITDVEAILITLGQIIKRSLT